MTSDTTFDLSFRPETSWPDSPSRDVLLTRIKGQARREMTREAIVPAFSSNEQTISAISKGNL